jgi:hypothetical protein
MWRHFFLFLVSRKRPVRVGSVLPGGSAPPLDQPLVSHTPMVEAGFRHKKHLANR